VYRAHSDEERARLLRSYAVESSPRAAWALSWLARPGQKGTVEFFRKLILDRKLPLDSQIALDRGLSIIDRKKWVGSAAQVALHNRWRAAYKGLLPDSLAVLEAQRLWSPDRPTPFGFR
jgi:hypothetical protein